MRLSKLKEYASPENITSIGFIVHRKKLKRSKNSICIEGFSLELDISHMRKHVHNKDGIQYSVSLELRLFLIFSQIVWTKEFALTCFKYLKSLTIIHSDEEERCTAASIVKNATKTEPGWEHKAKILHS